MGAVPPQIPGQGKEPFSWIALWLTLMFVGVSFIPAYGVARMLIEIVYRGKV